MTHQQYQQYIEREISSLNMLIDEKILHGLSYRSEARRHRELIRQARKMRRQPLMLRMLSFISLF
jgi:hypothetical protein